MITLIKKFFLFLLPIIRKAAVQVAAEELTKAAYPENRKRTPYSRMAPRTSHRTPLSMEDVDRLEEERLSRRRATSFDEKGFHDVLMVAFDLTGPSSTLVHEWLMQQMPRPNAGGYIRNDVILDSWWIANDERFDDSDTDSAVFVTKGKQEEARTLLRNAGLVD